MYQQMYTFLVAIFFLVTMAHSEQFTNNDDEELDNEYQPLAEARSISNYQYETREILDDDSSLDELMNSMTRRDYVNLYQLLEHNARGFTNAQTQFQNQMLSVHNGYRARHCVPSLQLDDQLSRSAQAYAEKLAAQNIFQHSDTPGVGENLWMKGSSVKLGKVNGREATDSWYNEMKQYNFNQPGFSTNTGHFTQLVWKGTQRIGVGVAFSSDGTKVYIVAQYAPPGNYQGQFQNNVFPARC